MNTDLKNMCKTLRLAHIADIYDEITFDNSTQFLEALFLKELQLREEMKAERLIKKARFIQKKSLSVLLHQFVKGNEYDHAIQMS